MKKSFPLLGAVFLASCLDITLGPDQGVLPFSGTREFDVPSDFVCGNPIPVEGFTITTRSVENGAACEFSFSQTVPAVTAQTYAAAPQLKNTANGLKCLQLRVDGFSVQDGAGQPLNLDTLVRAASLTLDGTFLADRATIAGLAATPARLPVSAKFSGTQLDSWVEALKNERPISLTPNATATLSQPWPSRVKITYRIQPIFTLDPVGAVFNTTGRACPTG